MDNALKQGFVTLGTDGGHKSTQGFDGTFALDDEALRNFGKESVKKGHDVAIEIIKKAYGRAPERSYFIGGSQGGHEALDAAARYPNDYDGVVAHYPAYNVTLLHLGSLNVGRALYEGGGAAWINPTELKVITDAVYAKCDDLDGAKDGIIGNIKGCNAAFDVKSLRCANGSDTGDACLSDAQLAAVAKITSDYKPGFAIAWHGHVPALGAARRRAVPGPIELRPGAAAVQSALGQGAAALYRWRPDRQVHHQPQPQARHDDVRSEAVSGAHQGRSPSIMDVSDVSLEKFKAKGGKIIMTHGTVDDFITPHNTELYYQRQVKQFGQSGVDSFMRFYMIPGFGHGFGPFNAKIDGLTVAAELGREGSGADRAHRC